MKDENQKKEIKTKLKTDCILIDEIQDVSTTTLKVLMEILEDPREENSLFFTGDLRQKSKISWIKFSQLGLDFRNKSFTLKQNYRNTKEILEAAEKIVEKVNIETEDELDIVNPEFSHFKGIKPVAIDVSKFNGLNHEDIIFAIIKLRITIINNILIICENDDLRNNLENKLKEANIGYKKLQPNIREFSYQDTGEEGIKVFITPDMKTVKGREFDSVIITDLTKGKYEFKENEEKENTEKATFLYIAMTRARDELIFTYEKEPSNFLEYIKDKIFFIPSKEEKEQL